MKTITASMPAIAATTPCWIDAAPRLGPTVRVSRNSIDAGSAPVRSIMRQVLRLLLREAALISALVANRDLIPATSLTLLSSTIAIDPAWPP